MIPEIRTMDKVTINGVTYSLGDTVIYKGRYGLDGGVITVINKDDDEYPLETDSDFVRHRDVLGKTSFTNDELEALKELPL